MYLTQLPVKVAILGAGISGLTAAWMLKKRPEVSVTVFEKKMRPGGYIHSHTIDDYFFEAGPHSMRVHEGDPFFELVHDLKLEDQLIYASEDSQIRYIYIGGKLKPLRLTSYWREALKDLVTKKSCAQETVYDFFSRRFSVKLANQLIDPLCSGIFADDPKKLSMEACFPQIFAREQKWGSVLLSTLFEPLKKSKIVSFRSGLKTLTDALANQLDGIIHYDTEVSSVSFENGDVFVYTPGQAHHFDHVISTLPNPGKLFSQIEIPNIEYNSVGIVHLGYEKPVLKYPGFGYLVPREENEAILGVIFDSQVFPEQNLTSNQTRLTVMMAQSPNVEVAKQQIQKHLNIKAEPEVIFAHQAHQAIPRYSLDYLENKNRCLQSAKKYPNLTLLGTSFCGVSIPEAISAAMQVASFQKRALASKLNI